MLTRRALTRRVADESGQSLVLALLVLTFLAVTLGGVIFFTAGNQRNANYQKSAQLATSLAEAGVNNAVSILSNPANANYLILPGLMPGTEAAAISAGDTKTGANAYQPGTTVTWWGTYCDQHCGNPAGSTPDQTWTLTGKATVPNPTGPTGSQIVKTLTAQVQVHQPKPGNIDVGVWNTIYSPYGPSSGCDTTVAQGVTMTVPLYVGGNLCVQNSALVNAPVYVGGFLYFANKQASVGCTVTNGNGCQTSAPVHSAHVGSYCQVQNTGTQVNPCKSEPHQGNQPSTNIWVQNPNSWNPTGLPSDFIDPVTGQLITAPPICWAASNCPPAPNTPTGGWYTQASPGPLHPCATVSGTPPTFDNNQVWGPDEGMQNGSVPGTFNLTPTTSYTCKTQQGELSWNAATRVLTVNGTIFIDGSVTATTSGNTPITYTGWGSCTSSVPCDGVIYVTGTVYITSEKLCAQLNAGATDCDWTNWDPNKKILIFLAYGQNSQTGVGANQGIVVGPTQTSFQGGLYARYQVNTGQGAATQGPLVSGTQTVVTGQQFVGSFPPINILPISIQGPPQAFYVDPPTNFQYGGS